MIAALLGVAYATPSQAVLVGPSGVRADDAGLLSVFVDNTDPTGVANISIDFIDGAGGSPSGKVSWSPRDESWARFRVVCEFDLMWDDASGLLSGAVSLAPLDAAPGSGDQVITVENSFDDKRTAGQFLTGSLLSPSRESTPIPEPITLLLFGMGLTALGLARRRRR